MNSQGSIYFRTLRYYKPYTGAIVMASTMALLTIGLNLLKPWPLKHVVDTILPGKDMEALGWACGILVGIHLLWGIFNLVNNQLQVKIGLQALARVRMDLFGHLQRLSLKFHDSRRSADMMYRVSYDAQAIQSIFNKGFSSLFTAAVTLLGTLIVMIRMDWQLTLLALGVVPVLLGSIVFFARRIRQESTELSESESALNVNTQEGLAGIRIVHAFGREDYELNRFERQCMASLQANLKLTFTHVSSALVIGTLMAAGTAAMIWLGARHVMSGQLSIGELLVFISYLGMLYDPLQTLSYTSWALEGAAAGAKRVFEILDTPEDVRDRPGARAIQKAGGTLELDHAAFAYDEHRVILKDVTLKIPMGATIAFVGATGAGKTTLLSLIPRFYDPTSGAVKLDGVDIRELQKKSLRSQVGMVLQDTMLLAGSVRENIAYGRIGASQGEIEEAARAAQAHDFIQGLSRGYDTEVGERGIKLSAGQRQRIGIARAFLKDAPILLLDEPTSALDPETEVEIMKTLHALMKGRTTVIVTHRISTVHHCDRIYVLEGGKVVEEGLGPDLLQGKGCYARLYEAQMNTKA